METLMKRSFFGLVALLAFTTLRAQNADEIVNKYIAAMGGKDVVTSVKSLVMTGNTSVMGQDGNLNVTLVVGKGYKSDMDFSGTKVINCITPTQGWMQNPYMGAATPTAMPDEQLKGGQTQLQLSPLLNYAANGYKIEYTGKDSADFKIKMTANGQSSTFYINQTSYLLDKFSTSLTMGGQSIDISISFADYQKVDGGLMYPHTITSEYPGATLVNTIKTVTVNSTVDPSVFVMPKQ
jgi:hypothetical protein